MSEMSQSIGKYITVKFLIETFQKGHFPKGRFTTYGNALTGRYFRSTDIPKVLHTADIRIDGSNLVGMHRIAKDGDFTSGRYGCKRHAVKQNLSGN